MSRNVRARFVRLGTVIAAMATVLAASASVPAAQAGPPRAASAQVSADAAAATVLTWRQLSKLLSIPKAGDWVSGDLASWDIGGQVSASRLFSNRQTSGSYTDIYTGIDSWVDGSQAAQDWKMLQDGRAQLAGVTVVSRTATRAVTYEIGQYNVRGATVSVLLGTWAVSTQCTTRKPKVDQAALIACANKVAKAQRRKSTAIVQP
jgi:hypothetical protein